MPNILQIKHSSVTTAPTSLEFGELAYSELSSKLFVGKADHSVLAVGGDGAFAPLNSPTLTGTPTAPNAALATNTQQLASTAFVHAVTDAAASNYAPAGTCLTPSSTIDGGSF